MLHLFGIYIMFGALMTLSLLAFIKMEKIVIVKEDKLPLFNLCCALTVAYPYFAIKAVYKMFAKVRKGVIEAEVVK